MLLVGTAIKTNHGHVIGSPKIEWNNIEYISIVKKTDNKNMISSNKSLLRIWLKRIPMSLDIIVTQLPEN